MIKIADRDFDIIVTLSQRKGLLMNSDEAHLDNYLCHSDEARIRHFVC